VFATLRHAVLTAIGRDPAPPRVLRERLASDTEASKRIEAARRRLKAAIPPPPD
jgi:hypothetical protein